MNDNALPSADAPAKIPYTGLRPFEPHEAGLFFGRADQIEGMLARLETNRFLAVVGASGCGKSSLVRAGLLPALADGYLMGTGDDWRFVIARPGDAPFANLAQAIVTAVDGPHLLAPPLEAQMPPAESGKALAAGIASDAADKTPVASAIPLNLSAIAQTPPAASPDAYQLALVEYALRGSRTGLLDALAQCGIPATTSVLVLIDQFEELFRFRDVVRRDKAADTYETRNEAMAFVDVLLQSLTQTKRGVFVVITIRSDFMGDCDAFPSLPDAISDSQFLAPRMTRPQLREAISDPLASCAYGVEPGFVNRVLNDVGSDPDQLPLMQHALLRTWQRTREARSMGTRARHLSSADLNLTETEETGTSAHPPELQIADYEHVGGVSGALDKHADEIFHNLGDDTTRERLQGVAERLFCSLSERRDDGPLTRRPIKIAEAALEVGDVECSRHAPSDEPNRIGLASSERRDHQPEDGKPNGQRAESEAALTSSAHHAERDGDVAEPSALQDVAAVARAFQTANLLVFSPPDQPLGPQTRLDISHESLLRQWSRLQAWIDAETKSALIYRGLVDAVRRDEEHLGDTLLDQAQEWLKSAQSNVHWAMRYDGAEEPTDSLFDRCLSLIESSHQARLVRIAKDQAAADHEKELLTLRAEAESKRATAESQRAYDAESAAIRFRRRTHVARIALLFAVVFMVIALCKWREASIAQSKADTARDVATDVSYRHFRMYSEPTALCGRIVLEISAADSGNEVNTRHMQTLLNELEFNSQPFAHTGSIAEHINALRRKVANWERKELDPRELQQSVLKLAQQYRLLWDAQLQTLRPEAQQLMRQIFLVKTYNQVIDVTRRLALQPTDKRMKSQEYTEFENLYWGELVLLENREIESAMVRFRKSLLAGDTDLQIFATNLKEACERVLNSLAESMAQ